MANPLTLTSAQVTVVDNLDALLNQAMLNGVVGPSGAALTPNVPAFQQYNTLSAQLQTATQAALRNGFSALISALGLPISNGATGTITLAPLTVGTGSRGSITVSNGIITSFTNPT